MSNNDQQFPNILTETAVALGKRERAHDEYQELKSTLCRPFVPGLCVCGCNECYWSIGSWMSAHCPSEETMLREINRLKQEIAKLPKTKKHAGYELGAREFTLTYSPRWMSDQEARIKMSAAINKLLKYYRDEIVELRAVGEVGSNGLSHVHCFYKLSGGVKITDKNFKRAWSHWNPKKPLQRGFEGGHHATVKCDADFKGYIEKDLDTAWLDISRPLAQDPQTI